MSSQGVEALITGAEALMYACSLSGEMSSPGRQNVDEQEDAFKMNVRLCKALENDSEEDLKHIKSSCGETVLQNAIFKDYDCGKILHVAVRLGAAKCLRLLLSYKKIKADIEAPDDKGRTALLVAVACAEEEAVRELMDNEANVNARDNHHCGVLHLLLLELYNVKMKKKWNSFMGVADLLLPVNSKTFHSPPLDKLDLESHANLAICEDVTPLSAASAIVQNDKSAKWVPNIRELCIKLIKAGAYCSKQDKAILMEGIINFKELERGFIQKALPRKSDLDLIDEVCRGRDNLKVKKALEKLSKDGLKEAVNSQVGQYSLLFWAVDKGNLEMVNMLMEFDADPRVGCKLPIEKAAEKGLSSFFEVLMRKMEPLSLKETNSLKLILENGKTDSHKECLDQL